MPIFEYRCNQCGNSFEYLVRSNDTAVACPHCNSEHISKLISSFAYRSSGSGEIMSGSGSGSGCSTCSGKSCSTCH